MEKEILNCILQNFLMFKLSKSADQNNKPPPTTNKTTTATHNNKG
jgi:hypothetical protein